jgi:YebC/PmpR family DNA-binding regulatory protein
MSGHSKWAQIKRQKGVADTRRGQLFTKLTREIMLAVKQEGNNPETNYRLRLAVQKAKDQNMPTDNIERAIKRSSGEAENMSLSEVTYEGYGPGGIAILLQVLTDNRNRALQEIRNVFAHCGGSLGEAGCVSWMFDSKGTITIETGDADAEETALCAIDAGAEDVKIEKGYLEIRTEPQNMEEVRQYVEERGIHIASAEISMVPKSTIELDEKEALRTLKLLDKLDELDDVQRASSNVDFSDAVLESLRAQA